MEVASALVGDGKSHFLLAPWSRWQHPLRPVVKNGGQVLEGHRESRASRFPAMHDRPEPSAHSSNWGRAVVGCPPALRPLFFSVVADLPLSQCRRHTEHWKRRGHPAGFSVPADKRRSRAAQAPFAAVVGSSSTTSENSAGLLPLTPRATVPYPGARLWRAHLRRAISRARPRSARLLRVRSIGHVRLRNEPLGEQAIVTSTDHS